MEPGPAAPAIIPEAFSAESIGRGATRGGVTCADNLLLSSESLEGAVVLSLRGELDIASAPLLSRHLRTAQATGPDRMIIDLSELGFIDSRGLHELLRARQRSSHNHCRLSLRWDRERYNGCSS